MFLCTQSLSVSNSTIYQLHFLRGFVFGVLSIKASYPRSSKFSPIFYSPKLSSLSFTVLCFTSRLLTYFELVFVKGERPLSRFIFLHVDVQLSIYLHFKDEQFQYSHMFGLFYQCIPQYALFFYEERCYLYTKYEIHSSLSIFKQQIQKQIKINTRI